MIVKLFTLLISFIVSINSQNQCGIPGIQPRVEVYLNNKDKVADDGQWPWAAALYLKNENQRQYFCSGTLISDQYVLTAAHCIQNKAATRLSADQISVTLGAVDSSNNNGDIYDVIDVKTHPEWNTTYDTKFDADLAIIKLNSSVEFSPYVQPACLPTPDEKVFEVTGFVAGYGTYSNEDGIDGKLRYLQIPTVTQENCLWHPGGFAKASSKRTFCGGDLSKSACKGDSGAGFVTESLSGLYQIIGIVSAAILSLTENCQPDSYVVFTNVPLFVNWILTETGRADVIGHQAWNPYNPSTNIISPDSIYVDEGGVKAYIARRKIGDNLIVGKFFEEWKSIYVPYFGGELKFEDGIEILATTKNPQWIPFSGSFPHNAVQGGHEGGAKLFVGRKIIDDKSVIGKIIDKTIYVPYFSKELSYQDFDILVLCDESWTPYNSSTDSIPVNSISIDEGGAKTFVARRRHANNLIIGKFLPSLNSIFLPFMGQELKFEDRIELLTTNKTHQWIPFEGTIPTNAVLGGFEGSAKLYVGRRMHEGKNTIGKVIDTTKTIYIGYFSKEYAYSDSFEILVLV
ncbi:hypothetical protein ACKWTF_015456 [Chironomus riparius]